MSVYVYQLSADEWSVAEEGKDTRPLARCPTEADAWRIADALNEVESHHEPSPAARRAAQWVTRVLSAQCALSPIWTKILAYVIDDALAKSDEETSDE